MSKFQGIFQNNKYFFCKDDKNSINFFYDVILYNRKIRNEEEQKEFDASYFAMCLLIPDEPFNKIIEAFGGLENVINNYDIINRIAEIFIVEDNLIRCRIIDKLNKKESKKIKVIKKQIKKPLY